MLRSLLLLLALGGVLRADVLDEKVPWSGALTGVTLGEALARMQGWAEGEKRKDFVFRTSLALSHRKMGIRRYEIPDQPRPTYGQVLSEFYKQAGLSVVIRRGKEGIEVTPLYNRKFRLDRQVGRLKREKRWSTESLRKEMETKGWKFSTHFQLTLIKESYTLVVTGLSDDVEKVGRFFGE